MGKGGESSWFELNSHHPHNHTRGISYLYNFVKTGIYTVFLHTHTYGQEYTCGEHVCVRV